MNPAAHELIGRAEGLAAGLGASAVCREHVVLAYLWDASSAELEMLCGVACCTRTAPVRGSSDRRTARTAKATHGSGQMKLRFSIQRIASQPQTGGR
jgi:hypothetical protein